MNPLGVFFRQFRSVSTTQGAVSLVVVAFMALALIAGSLFSRFVPPAFAQPQINLLEPDYVTACDGSFDFHFTPNVDFDDAANFDYAEWWMDELTPVEATVTNSDGNRLYFEAGPIDCAEYGDGQNHTFNFIVYSSEGTESTSVPFSFGGSGRTVSLFVEPDDGDITLTDPGDEVYGDVGIDTGTIANLRWRIDGGTYFDANADDGFFDSNFEYFTIYDLAGDQSLSNGTYTLEFEITDEEATTYTETYNLEVAIVASDTEDPTCGTTWYNQPSPSYVDNWTYTGIVCSDNVGVSSASWRIYHYVDGELITDTIDAPLVGSFGDTEVTLEFTAEIPAGVNHDGALDVELTVNDAAGNSYTYKDPLVVDYEDQTEPIMSLQLIRPEILVDRTPTVTGTCTDNTYRETNSNIQSIEVNVDGGGWTSVPASDGSYNSTSERFIYTTSELSYAHHIIDVRCTDAAGNVNTTSDSEDLEFDIEEPSLDDEAVTEEYTEDFLTHEHQDFAGTTLIWGNGRLRLKEDISVSRQAVDTTGFADRYETFATARNYLIVAGVDANIAWYSKHDQLWKINRADDTVTQFNPSDYGIGDAFVQINDIDELTYNGNRFLLVASENGFFVFNLTATTGFRETANGEITRVTTDLDRGRFGAYTTTFDAGGGMKLAYWQLGTGGNPFDGDTFTRVPTGTASMAGTDVVRVFDSPVANEYYISVFGTGVYRWNDNNTPTNFADDQADILASDTPGHTNFEYVYGGMFDPSGKFIFGTSFQESGELYVVDSDAGTPYDTSDDTVYKLAEVADLGYNDVFDVTYLEGEDEIGDQLFIAMENGNPVYLNFNDTYADTLDDTFIELETNAGIRPSVTQFLIDDYNTFYANIDRQGLYKVSLNRGWETTGEAIALPPRPSKILAINNFLANATTDDPISYIPGSETNLAAAEDGIGGLIPQAFAQSVNITYYVSLDDGVNWEQITLGELQQVDLEEDYRLQFKIVMTPIDGSSPVVNTYSVEYGAYPDPDVLQEPAAMNVTVTPSTFGAGSAFTLAVDVVDVINFLIPDYNGTVDLQLLDTSDQDVTSRLSINQMTIVNGEATSTGTFITQPGTYTIVASNGDATGESSQFTVTGGSSGSPGSGNGSSPSPTKPTDPVLTFTANDYLICRNQPVELRWVSKNLAAATLNGQPVFTDGTQVVTPSQTTTYTLHATGTNGSLTHQLTVTVDPDQSSCSQSTYPGAGGGGGLVPIELPGTEIIGQPTTSSGTGGVATSPPTSQKPTLTTSDDQSVAAGETVRIWWKAPDAELVTVDYLGGATGTQGEFEFVPRSSQIITITAYLNGEKVVKEIQITVRELPFGLSQRLPNTIIEPIMALTRALPRLGIAVLAVGYLAVTSLLLLGAAALTPIVWNGDTLASALRAAGVLPFKKRHGYVYQTGSLSPVPFAILSVRSADIKRSLLATLFTGVEGEYTEPHLGQGNYQVDATHGSHTFPTLAKRPLHLSFLDFYKGEPVTVESNRKAQAIIVPMDPVAAAQKKASFTQQLTVRLRQLLSWLQWTVWPLLAASLVAVWLNPTVINILIVVIYLVICLSKVKVWLRRPSMSGVVKSLTGKRLAGVVVMLLTADGQLVGLDRTDTAGQYTFFVQEGTYTLRVIAEGYSWSEESLGSTPTVELKNKLSVSKNLTLKPFSAATGVTPFGL